MHTLIELLTRTLCDIRPAKPADAAYLFCQTAANEPSLFQIAKKIVTDAVTSKILILKTNAKSGYPGYWQWRQRLQAMGLAENQIEGVEIAQTPIIQTRIESQALIRHARHKGYTALLVAAPPFQQLRAFMTAVTVTIHEYPELSIYSCPGTALPWQEWVLHSQGTLKAKRSELIQAELERIHTYQNKGHLAPFEQVLAYLNQRE